MFSLPKAMRGRIALQKHLRAKLRKGSSPFAIAFGVRARPRAAFDFSYPLGVFIGTFLFHIHVMRTIRVRCVSFFC